MSSYEAKDHYRGAVAANYVRARAADPKWRREQETMRDVLATLPRGRLILDVPFGTGRFAEYYAAGGHHVVGADISGDMLAQARTVDAVRVLAPTLMEADAERLPLQDGAVDVIVCSRLFNWIPEPVAESILSEFRRVAREGIVLGVRVGERLSARAFARRVLESATAAPQRTPVGLAKAGVSRAARVTGKGIERIRRMRADPQARTYPKGYVVPQRVAFDEMLRRHGLTIEAVHAVDNDWSFRRLMTRELRHYRLRVTPSVGAQGAVRPPRP